MIITDTSSVLSYAEKFSFDFYAYPTPEDALERLQYIPLQDLESIFIIFREIPAKGVVSLLSKIHASGLGRRVDCRLVTHKIASFKEKVNIEKLKRLSFNFIYYEQELLTDRFIIQNLFGEALLVNREMYLLEPPETNRYIVAQRAEKPSMYFKSLLRKEITDIFTQVSIQDTLEKMKSSENRSIYSDLQTLRECIIELTFDRAGGMLTPPADKIRKFIDITLNSKSILEGERAGVLAKLEEFIANTFPGFNMWKVLIGGSKVNEKNT